MKHHYRISVISIILILAMLCTFLILPVNAATEAEAKAMAKIDSELLERMSKLNDNETIAVSVWITDISYDELKEAVEIELTKNNEAKTAKVSNVVELVFSNEYRSASDLNNLEKNYSDITTDEINSIISTKRSIAKEMYATHNRDIINKLVSNTKIQETSSDTNLSEIEYVCQYAPNIDMNLTKKQIFSLANQIDVQQINYRSTSSLNLEENDSFSALNRSTTYDMTHQTVTGLATARDIWGLTGANLKIGIVEDGGLVDTSYFQRRKVQNLNSNSVFNTNDHATMVASVIIGNSDQNYTGIVPGAQVFCASTGGSAAGIKNAVEDLLGYDGLNVINASCSYYEAGVTTAYYGDFAKWYDYISTHCNVHFALSAGNFKYYANFFEIGPSNNAYNPIVVGNCNNSGLIYGGTTNQHGASLYSQGPNESYKPDIVAPGVDIPTLLGTSTGTSFSAPLVASAMAQLVQKSAILAASPTLMKAVLLSGSTITSSMSSEPMISQQGSTSIALSRPYGAGMLNIVNSYKSFVDSAYYKSGTLTTSANSVTQTKSISKSTGKTIRVCTTWDKVISYSETGSDWSVTSANLDKLRLIVTTPSGKVYRSAYTYDNKQMVSFVSTENGTYTFKLERINSTTSGSAIDYAISYSVQ